jgi:hypothetical protein
VAGLLAYTRATGDASGETIALRIVENLYLPLRGRLAGYPVTADRDESGLASGSIVSDVGAWSLSTDTYCVFIALEALVEAYARWRDPVVGSLVLEFFDLVERDDLVSHGAQLHAAMTAARCAAVFARLTGEDRGLRIARTLYDDYRLHARTLNFASMNWYGRPDSWTEPCAIVDTQILARELWRATGERSYLDDAILIETNALGHAQKPGGGFGLDTVTTADQPLLSNDVYEAPWCCSMRGAVGLVDARLGSLRLTPQPGTDVPALEIESPHAARVTVGPNGAVLAIETDYPRTSAVTLTLGSEADRGAVVRVHLPSWAASGHITVELGPGETRVVDVPLAHRTDTVRANDGRTGVTRHFHGPVLLGSVVLGSVLIGSAGRRAFRAESARPIGDVLTGSRSQAEADVIRIGFAAPDADA